MRRRVRKLEAAPITSESIAEIIERSYDYDLHPIRCQYGAHLHGRRACDGVRELRSADCDSRASRKVLDEYFALVEQAIPLTEDNPLDRRS